MHHKGQDILEQGSKVPHLSLGPSWFYYIGLIFPSGVAMEPLKKFAASRSSGFPVESPSKALCEVAREYKTKNVSNTGCSTKS